MSALEHITPEQAEQIRADLRTLGVEGSNLLAIPPFARNADAHAYIREIMIAFLRAMFRSMPAGSYRWDPDVVQSELYIGYADPRNTTERERSPAVTVELSPFSYGQTVINDLLGGTLDGTMYHTALRNGAVVLRCRSTEKLEADSLAHVVMGGIKYMHQDIEAVGGFLWVDAYVANPSSGEQAQTSTAGQQFVANTVANVHYQESWKRPPGARVTGPTVFVAEPLGVFLD